jgi:hypothetical protein
MLLAVDVGNTNVKLGVYDDRSLVASWRLTTRREQTADEYGVFTHTMLRSHGLEPRRITDLAISSTVPAVQRTMEEMAARYFELSPFVVDPGVNVALGMRVDYPREVGPDRIVKVVAAVELYGPPLIIIDFGTATTFECVSPAGEFIGGAIAPGSRRRPRRSPRAPLGSSAWTSRGRPAPSAGTRSPTSSRGWSTGTRAWSTASSRACAPRWTARPAWWRRAAWSA